MKLGDSAALYPDIALKGTVCPEPGRLVTAILSRRGSPPMLIMPGLISPAQKIYQRWASACESRREFSSPFFEVCPYRFLFIGKNYAGGADCFPARSAIPAHLEVVSGALTSRLACLCYHAEIVFIGFFTNASDVDAMMTLSLYWWVTWERQNDHLGMIGKGVIH